MRAKELVLSGIAGATTSAILLICIAPLSATLTGMLLLILFSTIWGITAGLQTYYIWHNHSRIIPYSLGFIGYIVGTLGFSLFELRYQLLKHLNTGELTSIFLYYGAAVVVGVLSQLVLLMLLIALRQLLRMIRKVS